MFHRANFTTPSKEEEIAQDLITGIAILESGNHARNSFGKRGKRQQDSPAVRSGDNDGSGEGNIKERKAVHRDVERQRRREMANLFASMRSLLPLEYIKGKRSASDQMHEAVNYISHLKNNVKELEIKRDNLKKLSAGSSTTTATGTGSIRSSADNRHRSSSVTVSQCRGGVEISDLMYIDLFELEQKLSGVINGELKL
ncbi:hypothetical protein RHSIM_Rhsim03G0173700 [Rhododendron simsii]|uniref:BHLH domain-containing protein n=1 Tax=Rhododendron simsii TaxID=118357 RepID=A0A834LTE3_RHOSS|nr:hypothetical protein RHSIM_Rhsim03G0173700 [Rhododendron simsii]